MAVGGIFFFVCFNIFVRSFSLLHQLPPLCSLLRVHRLLNSCSSSQQHNITMRRRKGCSKLSRLHLSCTVSTLESQKRQHAMSCSPYCVSIQGSRLYVQ